MTDIELAEEIKWRAQKLREYAASTEYPSAPFCIDTAYYMEKIIAALRRGHERIDAKMADLLVDTTWRKAVGQCVTDICGLDGEPLGKSCDRLFISRERFDEHVAPLIRQCERPPSGEMVCPDCGSRHLRVIYECFNEKCDWRGSLSAAEASKEAK